MFNQNELSIIANLLNRVQITGQEAYTVAVILQKISSLMNPQGATTGRPTPATTGSKPEPEPKNE